ncbi:MAG: hypothetical protein KDJ77_00440 [Rhodobiaceae bacterium]|nr:hypothetical protein [Rhodobiaceae bacterium]
MAEPRPAESGRDAALAAYKALLRDLLDQRPSGTRQRLAETLGTHRSFISQVSNPALKVPLPAQHVEAIFRLCRFSADEKRRFLALYRQAHPGQPLAALAPDLADHDTLVIPLPPFRNPDRRRETEALIRDFADRVIALAKDTP